MNVKNYDAAADGSCSSFLIGPEVVSRVVIGLFNIVSSMRCSSFLIGSEVISRVVIGSFNVVSSACSFVFIFSQSFQKSTLSAQGRRKILLAVFSVSRFFFV